MVKKLISQGAEAKIFLDGEKVFKQRIVKGYRHPALDLQIRTRRTRHEAKLLAKAKELGVNVPVVFNIDEKLKPKSKYTLEIEFIDGKRLSESLNGYSEEEQFFIMKELGRQVSILHKNDLIHADLTTSNVLLRGKELFLIDFGLGFFSSKLEDKAVDLHLIKQALEAKHYMNFEVLFDKFLGGYNLEDKEKVLKQLEKVEIRGRYKS